jgi:hypothetical protein
LVGISEKEFTFEQSKEFANIDIPGLDFLGVLSKNEYLSKNRLKTDLVSTNDILYTTYSNLVKMPQTLSNNFIYTTKLASSYTKFLK